MSWHELEDVSDEFYVSVMMYMSCMGMAYKRTRAKNAGSLGIYQYLCTYD